jgi:release factor glutamine methyltransferase
MDNFLQVHLNLLQNNNIPFPELELRVLLNKTSVVDKEIIFSNFELSTIALKAFHQAIKRRINNEPISKIFNEKNFWKYNFFVNENVLDPRPETELVIEKVIKYFPKKDEKLKILDICTGSGCLAISLAIEYRKAQVTATDISSDALKVAQINANNLCSDNEIQFVKCDLIKNLDTYDIIVSNPPYLSELDYKKTTKEIQSFEPKIALIGGIDGLKFYRDIAYLLPDILSSTSVVFVEIGNNQAKEAIQIFKKKKIKCLEIVKDIQQLNRLLVLQKINTK